MRLICTLHPSQEPDVNPFAFSLYLKSRGIDNECEEVVLPEEEPFFRIWVYSEDQIEMARKLYEEYHRDPTNPKYGAGVEKILEQERQIDEKNEERKKKRVGFLSLAPWGKMTIAIILACIFIFLWAEVEKGPRMAPKIEGIEEAPLLPKVDKWLLFDYPRYFELRDELFSHFSADELKQKQLPIPTGALYDEIRSTPFWRGFYDPIVGYLKGTVESIGYSGPIFEKISQGELWRLFTPALLHFNLLHIFFNLLWFIILGNQIEYRIGSARYLVLIFLSALFSNLSQYAMSGSFFMGLSGVVVALAGFIFARQQVAPWEGYLLNRITIIFLAIYIFGMFVLQATFFVLQVMRIYEGGIAIANTAHIVGGIVGYLLGRLRLFGVKNTKQ